MIYNINIMAIVTVFCPKCGRELKTNKYKNLWICPGCGNTGKMMPDEDHQKFMEQRRENQRLGALKRWGKKEGK